MPDRRREAGVGSVRDSASHRPQSIRSSARASAGHQRRTFAPYPRVSAASPPDRSRRLLASPLIDLKRYAVSLDLRSSQHLPVSLLREKMPPRRRHGRTRHRCTTRRRQGQAPGQRTKRDHSLQRLPVSKRHWRSTDNPAAVLVARSFRKRHAPSRRRDIGLESSRTGRASTDRRSVGRLSAPHPRTHDGSQQAHRERKRISRSHGPGYLLNIDSIRGGNRLEIPEKEGKERKKRKKKKKKKKGDDGQITRNPVHPFAQKYSA